MGLNIAFGDMLLNFVMATMFLVLPTFWVGALSWAGLHIGQLVQGLSNGSKDAGNAGSKGVSTISTITSGKHGKL